MTPLPSCPVSPAPALRFCAARPAARRRTACAARKPLLLFLALACAARLGAQDGREQLGAGFSADANGPHALLALEAAHPARLKPELMGVHPRVFVTDPELEQLRRCARTTHREIWERARANAVCLRSEPVPAPAQGRRDQNDTALAIGEAAFMYKIEGDPRYLAAAKKFMDAAVSYDVWGYSTNKPNVDLAAGHLLYGLGWGYDLLYHDLTDPERARYRDKLTRQAHLLYESYRPQPGRSYTYSQNHLFIPAAGLGVAAYALYGEVPEAAEWARTARALYERVLATYSADGYYYEGFEYWVFSTPWLVHYLDALAHSTGEDLYDRPGLRESHAYVAHTILPDGRNVFDFGDAFEGALTRAGIGADAARTHPHGRLHSNYHVLYRLAQRFRSGEAQGVAEWLALQGQVNFEDYWSLLWYDPTVKAVAIDRQPRWHYFPDNEVVYWRSGWGRDATAIAIKCGPPEGHATAGLAGKFPDWRLEDGHAHPDAGTFILYAQGQYLVGETGYAGVPMTADQNTLLVDGHGQAREGNGHNAFGGIPYNRLDRIRLARVQATATGLQVTAEAAAAYEPELGVMRFDRTFTLEGRQLSIRDQIETSTPHRFSILFHFDGKAAPTGLGLAFPSPRDAQTRLEPALLTAAGPPGHVDRGPKEERGSRLSVSSSTPRTTATFESELKW